MHPSTTSEKLSSLAMIVSAICEVGRYLTYSKQLFVKNKLFVENIPFLEKRPTLSLKFVHLMQMDGITSFTSSHWK